MKTNLLLKSLVLPIVALMLFSCQKSEVEVTLPKVLGDNMVIQRGQDINIWGWGEGQGSVTVEFNGQTRKSKTDADGKWMVTFAPMDAGGPFEMSIISKDTTVLENILIGDVWVCSGQSNMQWTMNNTHEADKDIAAANYPEIRLFTVPRKTALVPMDDIESGEWVECSPATVENFSAVGYFFGKNIHEAVDVPVGLISSNWGGTNVETWTSAEMCQNDEQMKAMIKDIAGIDVEEIKRRKEEEVRKVRESLGALEEGMVDGKPVWAAEDLDLSAWKPMMVPGLWEASGLNGLDGTVWYRTTFSLSKAQAAKPLTVSLGPIDDSDITWINGKKVGEMYDKYADDRFYEVEPGIAREGENYIVVRIEDYQGGGGFHGDEASMHIKTAEGSIPLAGEWLYRVSAAEMKIEPIEAIGPNDLPTLLYNGMIHPLLNYAVEGAIWYQGEANADNAYKYRTRFPNMIQDWRNKWQREEMGFYFVQLANFMQAKENPSASTWAELREAQTMALELPMTGMAVIIDIGEADDIHPRNKRDVGYRLSLPALHHTYGQDLVYSSPMYKAMSVDGSTVTVEFDHIGGGLVAMSEDGSVGGFALAGEDKIFHWAEAKIVDNKVRVNSEAVPEPVALRYGWADNPDKVNLYNAEGLPANPFRTDSWKGITE